MLLCIGSKQRSVTSSEVPVRIPAKAILAILDVIHGELSSCEVECEDCGSWQDNDDCKPSKALFEFSEHVDTMALAVMAEEHGELEIRPRG